MVILALLPLATQEYHAVSFWEKSPFLIIFVPGAGLNCAMSEMLSLTVIVNGLLVEVDPSIHELIKDKPCFDAIRGNCKSRLILLPPLWDQYQRLNFVNLVDFPSPSPPSVPLFAYRDYKDGSLVEV